MGMDIDKNCFIASFLSYDLEGDSFDEKGGREDRPKGSARYITKA